MLVNIEFKKFQLKALSLIKYVYCFVRNYTWHTIIQEVLAGIYKENKRKSSTKLYFFNN